jgi:hypothetical protein
MIRVEVAALRPLCRPAKHKGDGIIRAPRTRHASGACCAGKQKSQRDSVHHFGIHHLLALRQRYQGEILLS